MKPLTVGSLFAGIGGFDLGFERVGMVTRWQCEIDQQAREVLALRFPHTVRFDDVRTIGAHILEPVDVICGGFPCQDLSVAGKRAGLAGARSGLFFEMGRIINELRPKFLVWENVPGLLSASDGRDFAAVLCEMARVGYSGCWTGLDSRYYGLAQRRQRIFGVFALNDIGAGRCAEILSIAARSKRHIAQSGQAREVTPANTKDSTGNVVVAGTIGAKRGGGFGQELDQHGAFVVSPTVTAKWAKGGGPAGDETQNLVVAATLTAQYASHHGRTAGNNGGIATGQMQADATGVRRLTPTECERLQGFPDGGTLPHSDFARYRMIGNAVSVPVAQWIAGRIIATEVA